MRARPRTSASVSGGYAVRQLDVSHRADDLDRSGPLARRPQGGWRGCRRTDGLGRAGAPGRGAARARRGSAGGRPLAARSAHGPVARDGRWAQLQGGCRSRGCAGRDDHEPSRARPHRVAAAARSGRRDAQEYRRMQKRSDDRLIAYLDGELDVSERREIEAWLDSDPAARDKLAALAQSADSGALGLRRGHARTAARPADRGGARRKGFGGAERKNRTLQAAGRGPAAALPRAVGGSGCRWPPRCSACCWAAPLLI